MKKSTLKNYLSALLFVFAALGIKAQNLVLNPSFENTSSNCTNLGGEGFTTDLLNWDDTNSGADSCSSPDLFSACNVIPIFGGPSVTNMPNSSLGYQYSRTGTRHVGIITYAPGIASGCTPVGNDQYREYIEGTLSTSLVAGQQYCVSFYVSLADKVAWTTNNIGVYFSNTLYQHNACPSNSLINLTPQLNYTCTPIADTSNWVRLQWNYTATGGENYFIIGNFFNNAATTVACNNPSAGFTNPYAYFYIDDVSIIPGACCSADILPQPALCSTAPSVTLSATGGLGAACTQTLSGVWSGTGITNATAGVFDPSVAGVGPHVISYSLSCGYVATTTITVGACGTFSVCQSGGDYTASGGTPTYTWSTWNPGGSTPITTQAQCTACNSSYTWFFGTCLNGVTPVTSCNTPAGWQQYATGATITSPGTYPILVQDAGSNSYTITSSSSTPSCTTSNPCQTVTVTTVASNSVACFGGSTGSATVTISPAGTYTTTWQPGNLTGTSQIGLAAGVYTITADPGGGCTPGTTTVNIAQPTTALTASMDVNPATCGQTNGSAAANVTGGMGSYTYTWSPTGGNASTATNLAPDVYTVTVTDANSCTVTATNTVSGSPALTVTINSVPYCTGDSTALTASGATNYTWTPSAGLSSANSASITAIATTPTVYTVTGNSATCFATATVSVKPQPTFTVNKATICSGDSALLVASDSTLSYTWTPSTGLNNTSNDTVKASPSSTTIYTITAIYGTCSLTVTDSVIVLTKPIISVLSPTVCSATSATITATGASTYTWSPASNLSTSVTSDTAYVNFPTTPGTYTVFGTAANGCKDTAVSQVTISNHLGIISGTPVIRCYGDYLTLVGVGASTYTWTSSDLTNLHFNPDTNYYVVADIANVGTYTVAIYGESHTGTFCNGYDTVTVTINPTPTVTAANPNSFTICAGSSATLTATSGGASLYNWSPATGLSVSSGTTGVTVATPPSSTNYIVTGSNSFGCSDTASFKVTVIPIPTFTLTNASICAGGSATLTATPTTSDAATYTWTPATGLNTTNGTSVIANPTATTIYTVNATTNVAGCLAMPQTTTVTVHALPTISVTPTSTTICSGASSTIIASNGLSVYSWSPVTSISGSSNTATVVANPTSTTIYTVSGIDGFGCQSNAVTATVNVTTIAASASVSPVCKGQTINLMANTLNGATYSWTGPNNYTSSVQNPIIVNSSSVNIGTYVLTVHSGNCTATSSVSVVVNAPPVISVTPTQTVCPNIATTYTAGGASTYSWSPSMGLNTTTGNAVIATSSVTTTYSVVGTDANGCSATVTTVLDVNPVTAAISANPPAGDMPLSVQFSNATTGGTVYAWNYGNGSTTYTTTNVNDLNTNTIYTTPGTYTVSMLAANATGCVSSSYITVIVTEIFTITIPNIFTPNGDGLNDNFFVKTTGLASIEMIIYDRWGLKMWESSSASGAWDGKNANDGTYFYIIKATSTKSETKEYKGFITLTK